MSHAELRRESHKNHVDKMSRMMHREAGGGVEHADKSQDEKMVRKALSEHDAQLHPGKHTKLKFADGGKVGELEEMPSTVRMDRSAPGRARGGSAKHKGAHVNVIVAPQGGGMAPGGAAPALGPPMMPPHPPMMPPGGGGPPPGGPPMGGAPGGMPGGPPIGAMAPRPPMMPGGGGPPGMPMRARGGTARFARGGAPSSKGKDAADNLDLQHPMVSPALQKMTHTKKESQKGRDPEWAIGQAEHDMRGKSDNLNRIAKPPERRRGGGVMGMGPLEARAPADPTRTGGEKGKTGPLEDKKPDGPDIGGAGGALGRLQKVKDYGKEADFKPEGEMNRGGRA